MFDCASAGITTNTQQTNPNLHKVPVYCGFSMFMRFLQDIIGMLHLFFAPPNMEGMQDTH